MLVIHGHQLGKMDANQVGRVVSKYSAKGTIIDFIICGHLHETMIRDIEELLEDVEMGETIKQFLIDVLDKNK